MKEENKRIANPDEFILHAVYNDLRIELVLLGQDGQRVDQRFGVESQLP